MVLVKDLPEYGINNILIANTIFSVDHEHSNLHIARPSSIDRTK
jgi:hypothetical protein